jgi:hypothetical protein
MKNNTSYYNFSNIVLIIKEDVSIRLTNKTPGHSLAPEQKWIDILKGTQLLFNSIDSRLTITTLSTNKTEKIIDITFSEFTNSLICFDNKRTLNKQKKEVDYLLLRVGKEVEDITESYIRDSKINMIIN